MGPAQQAHATNGMKRQGAPCGERIEEEALWHNCVDIARYQSSWRVDEARKTVGNPASDEFSYQAAATLLLRLFARPTILIVLSVALAEHTQMYMFCLILARTGCDFFGGAM